MRDGKIKYLGRKDFQVKIRGYRIELGEIESVLSELETVKECVVEAVEYGEEKRLVGYVVGASEKPPSKDDILEQLRNKLPDYLVPWDIVVLGEMKRNPNGKVDRAKLPRPEEMRLERTPREANSPGEELLEGIWEEVLKSEGIGLEEDFFEAGGHSLLATR